MNLEISSGVERLKKYFQNIVHSKYLSKIALHTGGLRSGTHCLMTVENLMLFQLLKEAKSHDRLAPFIFHFKYCATFFLYLLSQLYFTLYTYTFFSF